MSDAGSPKRVKLKFAGRSCDIIIDAPEDHVQKSILSENNFYELDLLTDLYHRALPGMQFLDVGANVGNHSLFLSAIAGLEGYAFEPFAENFARLKRNLDENCLSDQVRAFPVAVGAAEGHVKLESSSDENTGQVRAVPAEEGVEMIALDDMEFQRIDILKIDTEGGELDVLKGAVNTLARHRPLIAAEAATAPEFQELAAFLAALGYRPKRRYCFTPTYLFEAPDSVAERPREHASSEKVNMRGNMSQELIKVGNVLSGPLADTGFTIARRELFWKARYLAETETLAHLPFLFWLVAEQQPRRALTLEMSHGALYFALCQAVDRAGLDTLCDAIGCEETGLTDEIAAHNALNYDIFSRIHTANSSTVLRHLKSASIDLLVVERTPKGRAFDILIETWLPRLSEIGIAVFAGLDHLDEDTLDGLDEIGQVMPQIRFDHGDGLTVFLAGSSHSNCLRSLSNLDQSEPAYTTISQILSRLGSGHVSEWRASKSIPRCSEELNRRVMALPGHDAADPTDRTSGKLPGEPVPENDSPDLDALRFERDNLAQRVRDLENSTSWRLTRPMRRLSLMIRRRR